MTASDESYVKDAIAEWKKNAET
jgi:hypothetical protein